MKIFTAEEMNLIAGYLKDTKEATIRSMQENRVYISVPEIAMIMASSIEKLKEMPEDEFAATSFVAAESEE